MTFEKPIEWGRRFSFPENAVLEFDLVNPIVHKIAVAMAEHYDDAVTEAIAKAAKAEGITDLTVLNKSAIISAIQKQILEAGRTKQEWISVKDRLPENDYGTHWKERPHYLVYLANGLMMVATFGFKEYAWWIDSHSCVLSKEHYKEVTHWMPLPQPPKGE